MRRPADALTGYSSSSSSTPSLSSLPDSWNGERIAETCELVSFSKRRRLLEKHRVEIPMDDGQRNGKGQILTLPHATFRKSFNRFWWNLKLRTTPEDNSHAKFDFDLTTWVIWANSTQFATVRFLCLIWSLRHAQGAKVAPVDRFWRSMRQYDLSTQSCAFWGVLLISLPT